LAISGNNPNTFGTQTQLIASTHLDCQAPLHSVVWLLKRHHVLQVTLLAPAGVTRYSANQGQVQKAEIEGEVVLLEHTRRNCWQLHVAAFEHVCSPRAQ
jgi:hypothetical protein